MREEIASSGYAFLATTREGWRRLPGSRAPRTGEHRPLARYVGLSLTRVGPAAGPAAAERSDVSHEGPPWASVRCAEIAQVELHNLGRGSGVGSGAASLWRLTSEACTSPSQFRKAEAGMTYVTFGDDIQ